MIRSGRSSSYLRRIAVCRSGSSKATTDKTRPVVRAFSARNLILSPLTAAAVTVFA
jgi:hypothetical protein